MGLVGLFALVAVAAGTLGLLPWLAHRVRRLGSGGAVMGPLEEIWAPATHRARIQVETLIQRKEPAPAPGDGPWIIGPDGREATTTWPGYARSVVAGSAAPDSRTSARRR